MYISYWIFKILKKYLGKLRTLYWTYDLFSKLSIFRKHTIEAGEREDILYAASRQLENK